MQRPACKRAGASREVDNTRSFGCLERMTKSACQKCSRAGKRLHCLIAFTPGRLLALKLKVPIPRRTASLQLPWGLPQTGVGPASDARLLPMAALPRALVPQVFPFAATGLQHTQILLQQPPWKCAKQKMIIKLASSDEGGKKMKRWPEK